MLAVKKKLSLQVVSYNLGLKFTTKAHNNIISVQKNQWHLIIKAGYSLPNELIVNLKAISGLKTVKFDPQETFMKNDNHTHTHTHPTHKPPHKYIPAFAREYLLIHLYFPLRLGVILGLRKSATQKETVLKYRSMHDKITQNQLQTYDTL